MTTTNGPVTWRVVGEISERLARVEEWRQQQTAGSTRRGNRTGALVIGLVTAVVAPLVVTVIIAWLHLGNT